MNSEVADVVTVGELSELPLLAGADPRVVADKLKSCPLRTLNRDEALTVPGISNEAIALVLQGRLRVHVGSPESDPVWIAGRGDLVGELSLISGNVTTTAVAAEPSRILVVEPETFWSLFHSEQAFARNVLQMMLKRLHQGMSLPTETMASLPRRHALDGGAASGLHHRSQTFEDRLSRLMLRCSRNGKVLSVLVLALDGLAEIKREFGLLAGRSANSVLLRTLHEQVRPTDILGRLDRERFAIILNEADRDVAAAVARRVCEKISHEVVAMPDRRVLPPMTVSIGVAESSAYEKAEDLLARANIEFERAGGRGGGDISG